MNTIHSKAKIISCGIQKGGAGKTTLASILSFLLSTKYNKKVLVVDLDAQGNSTSFLLRTNIYEFTGKTICELLQGKEDDCIDNYIVQATENLHVIPSEDHMSDLELFYYYDLVQAGVDLVQNNQCFHALRLILEPALDRYDYIFLDLPPAISLSTRMALTASDFVIIPLSCERFCYDGLSRYLEAITGVINNGINPNLTLLGIVPSLLRSKASIHIGILEGVKGKYGEFVFNTIIYQKMKITEFTMTGISTKYKADRDALFQYEEILSEVLSRIDNSDIWKAKFNELSKEWLHNDK